MDQGVHALFHARWDMPESVALLLAGLLTCWVLAVLIIGCCASCTAGSFYEPISVKSFSFKRRRDWRKCFYYLLPLPLHVLRSMETASGGERKLFSTAEKQFLLSQRPLLNDAVLNFLVVRRSMMFVALIFVVLTLLVQINEASKAVDRRSLYLEYLKDSSFDVNGTVPTFDDFLPLFSHNMRKNWSRDDPEAWIQYTIYLLLGMCAKILSQTALVDVVEAIMNVACHLIGCVYLWLAFRKWARFQISSRKVLAGWAFGLLGPFLATLIPTRLVVNWNDLDPAVETFAHELTSHLGSKADDLARALDHACNGILEAHTDTGKAERMVRKACETLKQTPDLHLQCCGSMPVVDFDFRPIHSACAKIGGYLDLPDGVWHQKAVDEAVTLCNQTVLPNLKNAVVVGYQNVLERANMAVLMAQRLKQSASLVMGFATGLRGFNTIMPTALALTPALLRCALKVKAVAPQSTMPGMFVVVLPVLYCPMTWSIYHIAFQLLGDLWMLLGLLVVAFAPVVNMALGYWYSITQPLTDKAMAQVMLRMNRAFAVIGIVAGVFIAGFAWKRYQLSLITEEDENSLEREAFHLLGQQVAVLQASFWLRLAGVALGKYFFTTLAGVDWMLAEIGRQRHYELKMEISERIRGLEAEGVAVRDPPGLGVQQREEFLQAVEERRLRLDCVFYILYEQVPMNLVETQGLGSVQGGLELEMTGASQAS